MHFRTVAKDLIQIYEQNGVMYSLESSTRVMVLEHGTVVVQNCDWGGRHDVEVVRRPRVLVVVDHCGQQRGKYLQVRQPVLREIREQDRT